MIKNSPFSDAVEQKVPTVGGNEVPHLPSGGQSPVTDLCFTDAVATQVPNDRTGGLLPEHNMDTAFSYATPKFPQPGKSMKIG